MFLTGMVYRSKRVTIPVNHQQGHMPESSVTVPKFAPPPFKAQNKSGFLSALAFVIVPSERTIYAEQFSCLLCGCEWKKDYFEVLDVIPSETVFAGEVKEPALYRMN